MQLMLFVLIIFGSVSGLQAKEMGPLKAVEEMFALAKSASFATDLKAQKKVTAFFDYQAMSKKILAGEVKNRSAAELVVFQNQIQEIVTRTVYPKATDFLLKVGLEHELVEQKKTSALVLTVIKKRGEETEIESRFQKVGNTWKIYDIAIDDESWVENIKEQVLKTIKKKSWAGLTKSLNNRLSDLKSGKKDLGDLE